MKRKIEIGFFIALILTIFSLLFIKFNNPETKVLGGGSGTINQLDQFKATSSPFSAITTNITGKNLYFPASNGTSSKWTAGTFCLTGDTCITTWPTGSGTYTASGTLLNLTGSAFNVKEGTLTNGKICTYVTGTGLVCDYTDIAGSGATTTINGVNGPTFTFSTSSDTNVGITISPSLQWQISWLGTLASSRIASSSEWTSAYNFFLNPSSVITAGNFIDWSGNTLNVTDSWYNSATDVIGGFTGCSGIQYLGADGACHTDATGSGGGATTTINNATGPAFSFATTTDTNLGLSIITGGATATFTPSWIGTLADARITSSASWNAAAASTTALTPTYIRNLLSSTATGLTYGAGVFSWTAGYEGFTSAASTTFTTAYNERRQWDGGSTNLVAAAGRTSLGLTDTATLASTTFALASHTQATSTITGVFGVASGGTGASTLTGLLLGNGTNQVTTITNSSANWDTAYTDRLKWDGGATGLTAATGRTSLGLTDTATIASSTWAKVANNLSDLASASTARTNLGLGTMAVEPNTGTTTITTLGTIISGIWNGTVIGTNYGGTGTTTQPTVGQVLVGLANGTYGPVATSSLGLGGGSGESNTASNIAPGFGLWTDKVEVDLRFKSLIAGSNISMSSTTDGITISATGGSGATTLSVGNGFLYTATSTDSIKANHFVATSTTATSTFAGAITVGTTTSYSLFTLTGGYWQRTMTNMTNAFSILNAQGTTTFNIDTTATTTQLVLSGSSITQLYNDISGLLFGTASSTNSTASILFTTGGLSTVQSRLSIAYNGFISIFLPGTSASGVINKSTELTDPWSIPSITAANYGAIYSDDITRMIMAGTAAASNVHIRNGGFAQASQLYTGTTAQTLTLTTLTGRANDVGRGAMTYQGYHYVLTASTTNAALTIIKRATSSDATNIATNASWATSTISGTAIPTTGFIVGAANGNIYVATSTVGIQVYTISTTTNTLTATTSVVFSGSNILINNTRVNNNGIYVGFSAAPFVRKYTLGGVAVSNILNPGVAVPSTTGPDMFATPNSIYGLFGNSTTLLTKLLGY